MMADFCLSICDEALDLQAKATSNPMRMFGVALRRANSIFPESAERISSQSDHERFSMVTPLDTGISVDESPEMRE